MNRPREINKIGRKLRVANAKIKDDSGSITLVLWNEQIDTVKAGGKIKIENGYVNEWQGAAAAHAWANSESSPYSDSFSDFFAFSTGAHAPILSLAQRYGWR